MTQGDALHFINEAYKHAKAIGAVNEGVDLLMGSDVKGISTANADAKAGIVKQLGVISIRN